MKTRRNLWMIPIMCMMFVLSSCSTSYKTTYKTSGKNYSAPGQIKKATGSKSAKPFAPGQQKNKSKKH